MLAFLKTSWVQPARAPEEIAEAQSGFEPAERQLKAAIQSLDRRSGSVQDRVRQRLRLAEIQRRHAQTFRQDDPEAEFHLRASEATTQAALQIAAKASDSEAYVDCLDQLISVFLDAANYPALEKAALEATMFGAKLPHPDPVRMANRILQLGMARHENKDFEASSLALERAVEMYEAQLGPQDLQLAELFGKIGRVFRAQARHPRAQELLRRCLRIYENALGVDSPPALTALQQLAGSYQDVGDLEKAAAQYERALMLKMRKLGVENLPQVTEMQYSLALLHAGWGNFARARELLEDCIGAFRRMGGARLAEAHEILAHVHSECGHHSSVAQHLEQATKVWESCGTENRTDLLRNLNKRADLLEALKKKREAFHLRERAGMLEAELAASV